MDNVIGLANLNRRRSTSNPFFQRTEEDVRQQKLAELMKDDLEKLYTSDQLPSAGSLGSAMAEASDLALFSTKLWTWNSTLNVWQLHKAHLVENGLVVKHTAFFPFTRFASFCEGKTLHQNDYVAFTVDDLDDPTMSRMLVVWFSEPDQFVSFVSAFRGLFDASREARKDARKAAARENKN